MIQVFSSKQPQEMQVQRIVRYLDIEDHESYHKYRIHIKLRFTVLIPS